MNNVLGFDSVYGVLQGVLGGVLHQKRVLSLAQAVVGVCVCERLGVQRLGRSMATALGKSPKHCIKQADRLLSNTGVDLEEILPAFVPWVVGARRQVVVALDWTDFDDQDQTTLALSLVTQHGRATPLVWKTFRKSQLKDNRNSFEDELLSLAASCVPDDVRVTLLADRGFGDTKLYALLEDQLRWDYVIRFRGGIKVGAPGAVRLPANDWVPTNGRARLLQGVTVTNRAAPVGAVVCVKKRGMKDSWCLATSRTDLSADEIVGLYARRFTIEETFRDEKDDRFGLGLREVRLGDPQRRDRMLLLLAIARVLLTLLGKAGEDLGLDRRLRADTRHTKRSHALFNQGREYARGVAVTQGVLPALLSGFATLLAGLSTVATSFAWV